MSRRHILLSLSFVVLFLCLPLFGGTVSAASTHTKSANLKPHRHVCDPTEYADTTLLSSEFVSNDVQHTIINNTPANITQTITTSTTTSLSVTLSSEISGKADLVFVEASAQLGLSLTKSLSVTAGTSTTITAVPGKTTYIQHGLMKDTLAVHDYWVDDTCLHNIDDKYGTAVAPQINDVWNIWAGPIIK